MRMFGKLRGVFTRGNPRRQQRVNIVVGMHKTGTTPIRVLIDWHHDIFVKHGLFIPSACWTRYVGSNYTCGHHNIPWELTHDRLHSTENGSIKDVLKEIENSNAENSLIVTENLDTLDDYCIQQLANFFSHFQVRIIIQKRNPLDLLTSLYAEDNKWIFRRDFESWCRDAVATDPRLDADAMANRWRRHFQDVFLVAYEEIKSDLVGNLLKACDAPMQLANSLRHIETPVLNMTPGAYPLGLMEKATAIAGKNGVSEAYVTKYVSYASRNYSWTLTNYTDNRLIPEEEWFPRGLDFSLKLPSANGNRPLDTPARSTVGGEKKNGPLDSASECGCDAITLSCCSTTTLLIKDLLYKAAHQNDPKLTRFALEFINSITFNEPIQDQSPAMTDIISEAATAGCDKVFLQSSGDGGEIFFCSLSEYRLNSRVTAREWDRIIQSIKAELHLYPISQGQHLLEGGYGGILCLGTYPTYRFYNIVVARSSSGEQVVIRRFSTRLDGRAKL